MGKSMWKELFKGVSNNRMPCIHRYRVWEVNSEKKATAENNEVVDAINDCEWYLPLTLA